nr:unnamed protein product [Callosobruchus analis]
MGLAAVTSPFMTRKKNEAGEDVCISKIIHIQIRQKEPDILFYKYDFSESEFHRGKPVEFKASFRESTEAEATKSKPV